MKDTELITVDPKQIIQFAEEGGKFVFKPSAESELVKLLQLREWLDTVIDNIKTQIGEAGNKLNPNFRGVIGEEVKCIYRKFGAKYSYDWKRKEDCMPFLKKKEYYSVDSDKVDKYVKEVGELPEGIVEAPRPNTLTLSWKDKDDE